MDYSIEQWINGPASDPHSLLSALMTAAALSAEPAFIAVVVLWFGFGWLAGRPTDRRGAIAALLASGGALLINFVISHGWDRPRPFVAHPGTVHLLVSHSADASFPSDHAAAGFAIAAVLVAFHRRLGIVAIGFAALVCYARVYVGDHYPSDVAAGLVIGVAVGVLALTWLRAVPARVVGWTDRLMVAMRLLREAPSPAAGRLGTRGATAEPD